MILGAQTITVVTPPPRNRKGVAAGPGMVRQVEGCKVQPLASQEMWEGPEGTVTVAAMLFAPPDAHLRERELVTLGTDEYGIVGKPQVIPDLHGVPHHYEVRLREVRGPTKDAQTG